jgi:hypothetical protein
MYYVIFFIDMERKLLPALETDFFEEQIDTSPVELSGIVDGV